MKAGFFFVIAAAVVAAALIAACQPAQQQPKILPQPQENTTQCSADVDCGVGGCSGQVCTTAEEADGLITTCEYRPEYDCLKLTGCGCVDGKCVWQQNAEYVACLDKAKSQQQQ